MNKKELLNSFEKGYELIIAKLNQCPEKFLDYKPTPTSWSAREIIIHLVDSEANSYVRMRIGIAENGQPVTPYDQNKWAENLQYENQSLADNLELFKNLRSTTHKVLAKLNKDDWDNYFERGRITLVQHIQMAVEHVNVHLNQIVRNYESWISKSKN
jgi:hypothetical protein